MRFFNGFGQVLNAGVHGLAALDHMIHHQVGKDAVEALAQRHGHHAVFLFGRFLLGLLLRGRLVVAALLHHVFDLEVDQLAQAQAVFLSLIHI